MSVLARDIAAYQTAVDRYQQQAKGYNYNLGQYNNSMVTDANGNQYVYDTSGRVYLVDPATNALTPATLPDGKTVADYGSTVTNNPNYFSLRQNPITQATTQLTGLRQITDDNGAVSYVDANGAQVNVTPNFKQTGTTQVQLGNDWDGNPVYQTLYNFSGDASTYAAMPTGNAPTLNAQRPDPTVAQLRKLNQPSLAEQERTGLIGAEIVQGGVLSNGLSRAGKSTTVAPTPPPPDTPITPDPIDWTATGGGY